MADAPKPRSQTTRAHPRVRVKQPARCVMPDGRELGALIRDISLGGAFVSVAEEPMYGTKLTILLNLRSGQLRLPCVVRWMGPDGSGLEWESLGNHEKTAIAAWIEETQRERAT